MLYANPIISKDINYEKHYKCSFIFTSTCLSEHVEERNIPICSTNTSNNMKKPIQSIKTFPLILFYLLVGTLLLASCSFFESKEILIEKQTSETPIQKEEIADGVPQKAMDIAFYVRENNRTLKGYVGGRIFENRERLLPIKNKYNQQIICKEYDINPKVKGQNRGAERIVLGDDDSRYYTNNHYQSFIKF